MHNFHLYHLCLVTCVVIALVSCGGNDKTEPSNAEPSMILSDHISNQNVRGIVEDKYGQIWIATFRGLNKYDGATFHQYFCNSDSLGLPDNNVNYVYRDRKGRLWAATVNGVCFYDGKDGFTRVKMNVENKNVYSILEDSKGQIFFSTNLQVYKYNEESNNLRMVVKSLIKNRMPNVTCNIDDRDVMWVRTPFDLTAYSTNNFKVIFHANLEGSPMFSGILYGHILWMSGAQGIRLFDTHTKKPYPLSEIASNIAKGNDMAYIVHPYSRDELLIATSRHGLWIYNMRTQSLVNQNDTSFPFEAPDFQVVSLFTDSRGNLWMGSDHNGLKVVYKYKDIFNADVSLVRGIGHEAVVSLSTDHKNQLWIATKTHGVYVYNTKDRKLINVRSGAGEEGWKDEVYHIFVDKDGFVWMTTQAGVSKNKYENSSLATVHDYPIQNISDITQDKNGTVWVSSGVYLYGITTTGEVKSKQVFPQWFTFVAGMMPLQNGNLLISAFMEPLMEMDRNTGTIKKLKISQDNFNSCIRRSVYIPTKNIQESNGDIWFGTIANGLLHYDAKKKTFSTVSGLSCSDISSIEQDLQGNIWVSTMDGLNRIDHKTGQITVYHEADGIGGFQFYDRASCRLADGTLVFGGTHGLTIFKPQNVTAIKKIPIMLENLKVHNDVVTPGPGQPITESMETAKRIKLGYRQNSFSITFAAIDYSDYKRIHYYYRLKGHDSAWTDADGYNEAYFSNLPAGDYTFQVRITGSDSSNAIAERDIRLTIQPEPWRSWWAYCLYIIIIGVAVWGVLRFRRRIAEEKRIAQKAEDEREQEQRINKMNMSYFANISHEFRTPLTMISGPVEQLREARDIKPHDKRLLDIIARSVQRMLKLVNQLLDFNKLENDTLRLHVALTDVIAVTKRCLDIFIMNAEEKGITINTRGLEGSLLMWLDTDKLEKIINNLMSNAMKFTPSGGTIDVTLDTEDNGKLIKITVADTGKGIPESELENVFKRYYQLDNQSKGIVNWGSGIGLYYARALAKLHHGSLTAGNRKEGTGAVFTLTLPTSDSAYTEAEKAKLPDDQVAITDDRFRSMPLAASPSAEGTEDDSRPLILIVDDDTEVVHYLRTLLAPDYKVIYRFDAESALKAAREESPSLILSDVVMPGMSGYELCRQVKDDLQTSHIPVILVTAKITDENKVEGLESGADAYVTKPFTPKVLLAQVKSLITNRERTKTILNSATEADKEVEDVLSPQDKRFMDDLYKVMEEEMANAELDVNKVTEKMHVSRTKLYYKVKGLTGENPSVFFKTYKLNKAAALIKDGEYNISEIAFMTGFNTLSHFSTSFKRQFGCTPSEYGKKTY